MGAYCDVEGKEVFSIFLHFIIYMGVRCSLVFSFYNAKVGLLGILLNNIVASF